MDEPAATAIQFVTPGPNVPGGPWALRVSVSGTGFDARGLALMASVGAVPVQGILLDPDGSGFSGYLASTPADGDALAIGFAQLTATDLLYHPGAVA
ncbi:MAG: hypothetical protein ABSB69_04210 [Solirubrobacteraceae bacterium]